MMMMMLYAGCETAVVHCPGIVCTHLEVSNADMLAGTGRYECMTLSISFRALACWVLAYLGGRCENKVTYKTLSLEVQIVWAGPRTVTHPDYLPFFPF
jgi:hypothetical protein